MQLGPGEVDAGVIRSFLDTLALVLNSTPFSDTTVGASGSRWQSSSLIFSSMLLQWDKRRQTYNNEKLTRTMFWPNYDAIKSTKWKLKIKNNQYSALTWDNDRLGSCPTNTAVHVHNSMKSSDWLRALGRAGPISAIVEILQGQRTQSGNPGRLGSLLFIWHKQHHG